ncbi:MAG: hypothetical protein CM15mP83_4930 [Flavobacteriaceae bacterium]|nr:MAG: hypothetical protein CM15mP83_4930 [Flavobacteriaceae bacterium]
MSAQATYIEKNKKRFLEELFSLIRIPSISADSNYASTMQTAAQAVEMPSLLQDAHHQNSVQLQVILCLWRENH